ncbi:Detected protein of unknown function [Hibiscus syriacus]|uniref:Transcription repressor n=1 Tax=Hibiscus syriacus TaxID=106335 RepID=A0A6A3A582_HIBSY|nr:Detected protein of unknown function [Hibiscus syriacus]
MSKKLQKSLQDYLSKYSFPFKRCRHPKTLSFAVNPAGNHGHKGTSDDNNDEAATLADVDRFLFEDFKSLYIEEDDEINERRCTVGSEDHEDDHLILRVHGVVDDARSSAGTNSTMSISENMGSTSTSSINDTIASNDSNSIGGDGITVESLSNIRNECIAVVTCSHNPYNDFRRSMQDMVEARLKHHSEIDWDFMEELVFCYLTLNGKKSHKFILSALLTWSWICLKTTSRFHPNLGILRLITLLITRKQGEQGTM